MTEAFSHQCCFCAGPVADPRRGLRIVIVAMHPGGAGQELFAHAACLGEGLGPVLDPEVPFDPEVFVGD